MLIHGAMNTMKLFRPTQETAMPQNAIMETTTSAVCSAKYDIVKTYVLCTAAVSLGQSTLTGFPFKNSQSILGSHLSTIKEK